MRNRPDNAVDISIGAKLRERREEMGLLQGDLADAIEVSRQQIQKYESGENAMSPMRLLAMAAYLGVSPMYFLSGVSDEFAKEYQVVANFRNASPKKKRLILQAIQTGGAA